jgi:tetratricopeptide (TPR) repeat protein/tRNA A-37 threonylcarbamoyl transferase component Bud32
LESSEAASEDFDAFLASVDVPDRDWRLGQYRILEEIGRGGMGVIYRARHIPSQRVVALKRVLNYHGDSQETLVRFQREARAAASLDHPNILPIYDVGATEDRLPFFTMKFATGGSLLGATKAFRDSPRRAAKLISSVAFAVGHAHEQGILHRDLKPGNILLDARGEPLVSDFGLAKWLEAGSDLTRTLTVFGTPGYIAPEQADGTTANLTPATDVYSLGAILFELLAGRPPFLGEHALAVLRQAAENDPPKLRSIVPKISRDLETICARCLQREPELRYASAAALAEDLERWLEGRPITARPISIPARVYRWARRSPALAGALAICLAGAGVLAGRQVQNWKLQKEVRKSELAKNSVTILPFLDLDTASAQPRWTENFAKEFGKALSAIGPARVEASANATELKAATREFKTRSALFGTRRQVGNKTRLSIQLLTPDGDLLFQHVVDLSNPAELTRSVAPALFQLISASDWSASIAANRDPGLRNEQAREFLAAGRELTFHYRVSDFERAIHCFEKALLLEPHSALGHAYLASSAAAHTHYLADPSLLTYAQREAEEASRLAPNSGDVLRVLAGVNYQRGLFRAALEDGLRSVETGAPDGKSAALLGMVYEDIGRPDQALRWFELAKRFDARAGEYECHIGDCWTSLGDDAKARMAYRRSIDLHPERSQGWISTARLDLLSADFASARSLSRELRSHDPEDLEGTRLAAQIEFFSRNFDEAQKLYAALEQKDPDGGGSFYGGIGYKSALGRLTDNAARKVILLQECLGKEFAQLGLAPDNPDVLYRISAVESSLGKTEPALEHLQSAIKAGWTDYRSLSLDPRFDPIADNVRFQAILGKLKLRVEELSKATKWVSNE